MSKESELRTALLVSGGGSTAEAVIKAHLRGELTGIRPVGVISSKPDAGGIRKAEALGIETFVVPKYPETQTFASRLMQVLQRLGVDLVSQNGWLPLTPEEVVLEYSGRIINQHPGPLDPENDMDFGGKGMFGSRVTAAVLAYMWATGNQTPFTEATVHHVTPEFDRGELISIARLNVPAFDRPVTIAGLQRESDVLVSATERVQADLLPLEHANVITALQSFADGDITTFQRHEPLIHSENREIAQQAKSLGVAMFPNG